MSIETSSSIGSLAILRDGAVIVHRSWTRAKSHSEIVTAEIATALHDAGIAISSLHAIVVGIGPGSFTGIRVAVNVAKSLSYSLNIPVFAYDSLGILAQQTIVDHGLQDAQLHTSVDAQKNYCFHASWEVRKGVLIRTSETQLLGMPAWVEKLKASPKAFLLGDGAVRFSSNLIENGVSLPSLDANEKLFASTLGQMACAKLLDVQPIDWKSVQPLYIRSSEAEERLREGLLKNFPKSE